MVQIPGEGRESANYNKELLCCSEPEAAALLALATQFKPHVWMNVHSGMEALFMPYDHLAAIPKGATAQATLEVGHPLTKACLSGPVLIPISCRRVARLAVWLRQQGTANAIMFREQKDEMHPPIAA